MARVIKCIGKKKKQKGNIAAIRQDLNIVKNTTRPLNICDNLNAECKCPLKNRSHGGVIWGLQVQGEVQEHISILSPLLTEALFK